MEVFFYFINIFFSTIMQKPTPRLNVLNISLSDMFFDLIHLKIFLTLIFDKSIFTDKCDGTDLVIFSMIPPPVI